MPVSLQVFQQAIITDASGERYSMGSMVDPVNLSADFEGAVERQVYQVTAGSTQQILHPVYSAADTFSFLWVRANQDDVYLELVTDDNASIGTEAYTVLLKKGLAFLLGSDNSYANYTRNFAGGTIDVIDQVNVKNTGSATATVEVVVAK